jgi:hypothetical protein
MRLTYPKVPPRIRELAYIALNMELLRHPHAEQSLTSTSSNRHVPSFHKIFLLPPAAVSRGRGLKAAKQVSWYDIVLLSGVSHGIEIAAAEKSSAAYVTRGEDVDRQLAILTELSEKPGSRSVEVRVLRVPRTANFSFWLHQRGCRNDVLVPVNAVAPQLDQGKEYSPARFFEVIRDAASHVRRATRIQKSTRKNARQRAP